MEKNTTQYQDTTDKNSESSRRVSVISKLFTNEIETSDLRKGDDVTKTNVTRRESLMSSYAFNAALKKFNTSQSHCKDNVEAMSQNNRRKMANFKDFPLSARKLQASAPYRKPTYLDRYRNGDFYKRMNSSLSAVDIVPFAESTEPTPTHLGDTCRNLDISTYSNTLVDTRVKRKPPKPLPKPIRYSKPSECPGLTGSAASESLKELEIDKMKKLSPPRAPLTADRKRSPVNLNAKRNAAIVEIERCIINRQNVYTNVGKEATFENEKCTNVGKEATLENEKAVEEKEVTTAASGQTEEVTKELLSEEPCQTEGPIESEASSSDISIVSSSGPDMDMDLFSSDGDVRNLSESQVLSRSAEQECSKGLECEEKTVMSSSKSPITPDRTRSPVNLNAQRNKALVEIERYNSNQQIVCTKVYPEATLENKKADEEKEVTPVTSGKKEEEVPPVTSGKKEEEVAPVTSGKKEEEVAPVTSGKKEEVSNEPISEEPFQTEGPIDSKARLSDIAVASSSDTEVAMFLSEGDDRNLSERQKLLRSVVQESLKRQECDKITKAWSSEAPITSDRMRSPVNLNVEGSVAVVETERYKGHQQNVCTNLDNEATLESKKFDVEKERAMATSGQKEVVTNELPFETRYPPTRFPIPFRKQSECPGLTRSVKPSSLSGRLGYDGMKILSSSKASTTLERDCSPVHLNAERNVVVDEAERKNIDKEATLGNKKASVEWEVAELSSGQKEEVTNELSSEKRYPPTRFPVPFRKQSECPGLTRSIKSKSLSGLECNEMKRVTSLKAPISSGRERFPIYLNAERNVAAVETKRYNTHPLYACSNVGKEAFIENMKADEEKEVGPASSRQREVVSNELPSEDPSHTEGSIESEASSYDTDVDTLLSDDDVSSSESELQPVTTSYHEDNVLEMDNQRQRENTTLKVGRRCNIGCLECKVFVNIDTQDGIQKRVDPSRAIKIKFKC